MSECAYCLTPFQSASRFCCHSCELLSGWVEHGRKPLLLNEAIPERWQRYNTHEIETIFNISNCPVFKTFRIYVDGLQCSSCVHLLEDFHLYDDRVQSAKVNFATGVVEIQTKKEMGLGSLCSAIEQLGYRPTPFKESDDYELARKADDRKSLIRIGIAGALAGNLMLFSVPMYAGLDGELGEVFKWISFFLFLPVVLYVALPFYRKAWTSLLVRQISIDMMIVVALLSGFIFSTYSLVVGSNDFYFDSTASFIFLILTTRYFVRKLQNKLTQKNIFSDLFSDSIFDVRDGSNIRLSTYDHILKDQTIRLQKGQLLPCDSVLLDEQAEFDLSFLTGESLPRNLRKSQTVLAGSRLLNADADLHCMTPALASELAISLARIETETDFKNNGKTLTDLISHRLTLVVFSVVAVFFLFSFQRLGFEAFRRCLALITIACPCAVAFGTPLAHSLALRKAGRKGFFLKSDLIFEKLRALQRIVFDKTGTLTSPNLELMKTIPEFLTAEDRSIMRGLENDSNHPIAISLHTAWPEVPAANLEGRTEKASLGVEGIFKGQNYRLEKADSAARLNSMQVDYLINGQRQASLFFAEGVKPEAKTLIQKFSDDGFTVFILSGDQRNRSLEVGHQVGVTGEFIYSEKSSAEKKEVIQTLNPCLFVGDGLNDLAALSVAEVSFAVRGAFEATFKVSDIYAPKKDLGSIHEIFELAKTVHGTIRSNLVFALGYNAVGGALALLGYIDPLVAAVLMPISSALITLNTVWRLK